MARTRTYETEVRPVIHSLFKQLLLMYPSTFCRGMDAEQTASVKLIWNRQLRSFGERQIKTAVDKCPKQHPDRITVGHFVILCAGTDTYREPQLLIEAKPAHPAVAKNALGVIYKHLGISIATEIPSEQTEEDFQARQRELADQAEDMQRKYETGK